MKLTKEWVENELKHSEALENHRPPDEEYAFYCAVRDGDMEYVQKNCTAEVFSNPVGMGVLSKNPLQNIKISFCYHDIPGHPVLCHRRHGSRTGLPPE